jgi:hypothetical protein
LWLKRAITTPSPAQPYEGAFLMIKKDFLRGIFIFKNILLQPSRTYFHFYKKGFLFPKQ